MASDLAKVLQRCVETKQNVLLVGPRGSGKTRLARRMYMLLCKLHPLTEKTAKELADTYADTGLDSPTKPPFRAPHYSVHQCGMLGTKRLKGRTIPGECALAHQGILFLDEIDEFIKAALQPVVQGLSNGAIRLFNAAVYAEFPSAPMIIATTTDEARFNTRVPSALRNAFVVVRLSADGAAEIARDYGETAEAIRELETAAE